MSKMRWVRNSGDPENEVPAPFIVFVFVTLVFLVVLAVVFGTYGCNQYRSNHKMTGKVITQSNHLEVVKVRSDVMTVVRLETPHDAEPHLKTNDDYEVVLVDKIKIRQYGRSASYVEGVEYYIKVGRPCVLQVKYKNNGSDKLLYVKVELE